jgi:integrase
MGKKGLTAKQVQHLGPLETRYEVPAGPPTGLYLVIQPSGTKSWALRYRWHGQTRKLTFPQTYPDMGLAAARAEATMKLDNLDNDIDPAAVQAEEIQQEEPNTVKSVVDEWLKREVSKTQTKGEVARIMNKEVMPKWKHKLITDIARPDVNRLIDAIMDRKTPILANRTLSILKRFFRWTIDRGYIQVSPIAGIRPPAKEKTRDRVLTEEELTAIWNAAPELGFPFGDYFRFLALTGQRRGEVANMKWADIDLDAALWTLPKEATKAGRIHDVPLSEPAVQLLRSLPRFKGPYIFTTTSGKRPISGFSKAKTALNDAIVEARRKSAELPENAKALDQWGLHDLRRTLTTWMANNGVLPHVLAAILNHSPGSTLGITAVYARSKWSKEKREALGRWAQYMSGLEKPAEEAERAMVAVG